MRRRSRALSRLSRGGIPRGHRGRCTTGRGARLARFRLLVQPLDDKCRNSYINKAHKLLETAHFMRGRDTVGRARSSAAWRAVRPACRRGEAQDGDAKGLACRTSTTEAYELHHQTLRQDMQQEVREAVLCEVPVASHGRPPCDSGSITADPLARRYRSSLSSVLRTLQAWLGRRGCQSRRWRCLAPLARVHSESLRLAVGWV